MSDVVSLIAGVGGLLISVGALIVLVQISGLIKSLSKKIEEWKAQ